LVQPPEHTVEFADFACPHCGNSYSKARNLARNTANILSSFS
jgi:predicted RNA-binding Zn-ribbon protein involved in translation (DUF1610 family)